MSTVNRTVNKRYKVVYMNVPVSYTHLDVYKRQAQEKRRRREIIIDTYCCEMCIRDRIRIVMTKRFTFDIATTRFWTVKKPLIPSNKCQNSFVIHEKRTDY